jgi:hypothetical protein
MSYLDDIAFFQAQFRPRLVGEANFTFDNQSIVRSQKPGRGFRAACLDHDRRSGCQAFGSANKAILRHDSDRLSRLCSKTKFPSLQGVSRSPVGCVSCPFVQSMPLHR